jgi:hypothetical protein
MRCATTHAPPATGEWRWLLAPTHLVHIAPTHPPTQPPPTQPPCCALHPILCALHLRLLVCCCPPTKCWLASRGCPVCQLLP